MDAFEQFGYPTPTPEQLRADRGKPHFVKFTGYLKKQALSPVKMDRLMEVFWDKYKKYENMLLEPYDLSRESLLELKGNGHHLGVISNKATKALLRSLAAVDLLDLMEVVIGLDNMNQHKPNPEAIFTAWEKIPMAKEETVMIGDTIYDMQMGKMAGTKTVGITWGGSSAQTLRAENPDRTANSFVELEIIITSLLDA